MVAIMPSTRYSSSVLLCIRKWVRAIFGDPQVYRSSTMSPMQAKQFLLQQPKQGWLKQHSWRCSSLSSLLPIAYILLKQKKGFHVALPIIGYKFLIFAKLFRATATVLDLISREAMPSSFGLQAFEGLMSQIVDFFQNVADDCHLECYNQDLVGLFTSIPAFRIIESVDWMLQQFMLKHDIDPATFSFRVSTSTREGQQA